MDYDGIIKAHPELLRLTTPRLNKYIPHNPTPKQSAFLLLDCREALFGGAARGGKTDAHLMGALQYVDCPGYSAILLRRTYAELSGADCLIPRSHEWLAKTDAHWNGDLKLWTFPSGATLFFGYMDAPNDHLRYQGTAYHYIGFDELTQFRKEQYLYLFSRLCEETDNKIPLRVRSTTNPGGPGHAWVKDRFIDNRSKYGTVFIPSFIQDNPHINQKSYRENLNLLDPITRLRLEHGRWDAMETGKMFQRERFRFVAAPPHGIPWLRRWDLGATDYGDPSAGIKMAMSDNKSIILDDLVECQDYGDVIDDMIVETAKRDGKDVPIIIPQDPGSAGIRLVEYYVKLLHGYMVFSQRETGSKIVRARPFASQVKAGNVYLVIGNWNERYLTQMELFPTDGVHDEYVDISSGGYGALLGVDIEQIDQKPIDIDSMIRGLLS